MKHFYNWVYKGKEVDEEQYRKRVFSIINGDFVSVKKVLFEGDSCLAFYCDNKVPFTAQICIISHIEEIVDNVKTGENRTLTDFHMGQLRALCVPAVNISSASIFGKNREIKEPLIVHEKKEKPCCLIM